MSLPNLGVLMMLYRRQPMVNEKTSLYVFNMCVSYKTLSLQCRRILGGRKLLVYVRTVVTVIFVMTEEDKGE